MKLVVGLGNPGKKYDCTRHNIGFEIVDELAVRHSNPPTKTKFEGLIRECLIGAQRVLLLQPQTFMNLSGRSVRQATDFYRIEPEDVILVCDDFHLDLGTIRLRRSGSDGGQKGLADTIRQLGTDAFARLRYGIGPVPERWNAADFVLGKFSSGEKDKVAEQRVRSCEAIETWVTAGIQEAMNKYNGKAGSGSP